MTARPEFGAAIAVEGARPAWLPDDVEIDWSWNGTDWCVSPDWHHRPIAAKRVCIENGVHSIRLEVPRYDFVYLALERGMVPWFGGDEAPEDWDGGPYLCRDGKTYHMCGYDWGHGTHCWNETADWDRIGYTRKGTSATPVNEHISAAPPLTPEQRAEGVAKWCSSTALPLAHPAAPQGEDTVIVPRYPTQAMLNAARANTRGNPTDAVCITLWRAMVNAALAPAAIASGREGAE